MTANNDKTRPHRELWRHISESKLQLMRNLSYGGAGFCVANLLVLVQIGLKDSSLTIALIASSIAIPFWIASASAYETYILLGRRTYGHLKSDAANNTIGAMMSIAAIGSLVTVFSLIFHLSKPAATWFGVSVIAAFSVGLWLDKSTRAYLRIKQANPDVAQT